MTREEAKWKISGYKGAEHATYKVLVDLHNSFIDEIFDEHEVQLKAKENHIVELNKMVQAKDEEIERLRTATGNNVGGYQPIGVSDKNATPPKKC